MLSLAISLTVAALSVHISGAAPIEQQLTADYTLHNEAEKHILTLCNNWLSAASQMDVEHRNQLCQLIYTNRASSPDTIIKKTLLWAMQAGPQVQTQVSSLLVEAVTTLQNIHKAALAEGLKELKDPQAIEAGRKILAIIFDPNTAVEQKKEAILSIWKTLSPVARQQLLVVQRQLAGSVRQMASGFLNA